MLGFLKKLKCNKNILRIPILQLHTERLNKIESISKNISSQIDQSSHLSYTFNSYTHHIQNGEKINITPLLNNYNIQSPELLTNIYMPLRKKYYEDCLFCVRAMVSDLDNGPRTYIPTKHRLPKDIGHYYPEFTTPELILQQNKYNIKKLDDIELNITFRHNMQDEQIIDINNFDSIHGDGTMYTLLLNLLKSKIHYVF